MASGLMGMQRALLGYGTIIQRVQSLALHLTGLKSHLCFPILSRL